MKNLKKCNECLNVCLQNKVRVTLTKLTLFFFNFKVGSLLSNRIYKSSYLLWIVTKFFLVTLFSNDILSKLINPSYKSINSIEQLNHYLAMTTIIWKESFVIKNNLVYNLVNFYKLIIYQIN